MYLAKNPSKINEVLALAGKRFVPINTQYIYTIESLSTNVDMLFDRKKLKVLLKELAARGMLACEFDVKAGVLKYLLNENGLLFVEKICSPSISNVDDYSDESSTLMQSYFSSSIEIVDSLSSLQTQTSSKLNSYLNMIFKRI